MNKFANLLKSYANKDTPCECLQRYSILSGSNTKDKLERLFKLRQLSSVSPHFPESIVSKKQDVLVICLVIVDTLHHEDIWRYWIEEGEKSGCKVKLLIHAKYPAKITSSWVRNHTLTQSSQPDWNSIEVIRALLLLLEEGLKDLQAGRFVFGTESCLPIYSAKYIWNSLFREDVSWLNARHHVESKWEASNCFLSVNPDMIPPKAVWKSLPGWIMLTRRHVHEIICLPYCCANNNSSSTTSVTDRTHRTDFADLVSAFGPPGSWNEWSGGVYAPEEMYFPTMLALLGYLKDQPTNSSNIKNTNIITSHSDNSSGRNSRYHDEVRRQSVNHAEWKRQGEAHPITFHSFTTTLLHSLRSSGALFARKFSPISCKLSDWIAVVMTEEDDTEKLSPPEQKQQQQQQHQQQSFSSTEGVVNDDVDDINNKDNLSGDNTHVINANNNNNNNYNDDNNDDPKTKKQKLLHSNKETEKEATHLPS